MAVSAIATTFVPLDARTAVSMAIPRELDVRGLRHPHLRIEPNGLADLTVAGFEADVARVKDAIRHVTGEWPWATWYRPDTGQVCARFWIQGKPEPPQ